jgi:transcription antitermination factor NusG
MPFLPLEPFVFPNNLLTDPGSAKGENGRWCALYTRPRSEKSLARRLLAREVPFFLPLYKRQYRCSGRQVKGYPPLFTGYLFLHGDEQARIHALESNLVTRTIFVEDQAQLESDLAQVYRLMDSGLALTPEERLQPGTPVEITDGALAGIQGKVLNLSKKTRVVVEVKFLQSAVSVEVESWMIQPVSQPQLICTGS